MIQLDSVALGLDLFLEFIPANYLHVKPARIFDLVGLVLFSVSPALTSVSDWRFVS